MPALRCKEKLKGAAWLANAADLKKANKWQLTRARPAPLTGRIGALIKASAATLLILVL